MTQRNLTRQTPIEQDDVIVIGGGAAGLSAGLTLARARRRVTVIDGGAPRNAPAEGVHGLLGNENISPADYLAKGRAEAEGYGAQIIPAQVAGAEPVDDGFEIHLADGRTLRSRALIVASGVTDNLPQIPGLARQWGRGVLHCPYCHGWEVRDQRIGVLATSPLAWMQALMFHQWSRDLTLLTQDQQFDDEAQAQLDAAGITCVAGQVTAVLEGPDGKLAGVRLADDTVVDLDALAVHATVSANIGALGGLRLPVAETEMGTTVVSGEDGSTSVPGVWVAGNVRNPATQVSTAAADGVFVAARLNMALIFADATRRVDESRSRESVA